MRSGRHALRVVSLSGALAATISCGTSAVDDVPLLPLDGSNQAGDSSDGASPVSADGATRTTDGALGDAGSAQSSADRGADAGSDATDDSGPDATLAAGPDGAMESGVEASADAGSDAEAGADAAGADAEPGADAGEAGAAVDSASADASARADAASDAGADSGAGADAGATSDAPSGTDAADAPAAADAATDAREGGIEAGADVSADAASEAAPPDSGGSSDAQNGSTPPDLPSVVGTCPAFAPGDGASVTITVPSASIAAKIWAGSASSAGPGGPLILYWHATGSDPSREVPVAFDTAAVEAAGGIIAGFVANSRTGTPSSTTGNDVWYQSDLAFADQVVACAIRDYHVNPRHIHTAGYSAGALQTVYTWFARSGYIASAISYSGGDVVIDTAPLQNPNWAPPAIVAHGALGQDVAAVDFAQAGAKWESDIKSAGGFSIDCDDGGNHAAFFSTRAPGLQPVAWGFFRDHPYGVIPEPYASGLPSGFPSYCKID